MTAAFDPRLPRALHPLAWWIWALGLATAASRTTNPLLLGLIIAVLVVVVNARRSDAPWARLFRMYLVAGLFIVGLRVLYRILFGGDYGTHVIVVLPEIPLPDWAVGIKIGGTITVESVLAAAYDGLRLATLLICIGAANVLADAKRLLRIVPNALYEIGATLVVALTVAPQLVESVLRVRRARRLRGGRTRGVRSFLGLFLPVLQDALDRSLGLAAAMDARGYGRTADVPAATRHLTSALLLAGLGGICVGLYGLLDGTAPPALGFPMLAVGATFGLAGLWLSGRRIRRTAYRPDVWERAESLVAATGIAAAVVMAFAEGVNPENLNPSLVPLQWPPFAPVASLGILVAMLPAWLAPPVRLATSPARTAAPAPAAPSTSRATGPERARP
jgi:energy-coupling factor transport system permease protein